MSAQGIQCVVVVPTKAHSCVGVRLPKALGNANLLAKMARVEIPSRAESTLRKLRHRPAHSPYHDAVLTGSMENICGGGGGGSSSTPSSSGQSTPQGHHGSGDGLTGNSTVQITQGSRIPKRSVARMADGDVDVTISEKSIATRLVSIRYTAVDSVMRLQSVEWLMLWYSLTQQS